MKTHQKTAYQLVWGHDLILVANIKGQILIFSDI